MFTLQFAQTRKARNSTLIPGMGESCQCLLKENTSIIRPTFIIRLGQGGAPASLEVLAKENYCYCPNFNRYYYITNISSETAVIAYVQCEVDVLASFKEDILATPAFVLFAESVGNHLIPDNRLPRMGSSTQTTQQIPVPIFTQTGTFCLTAATPNNDGSNGPAATVVVSEGNLASLADKLYGAEWWDSIKNDFYHPEEALLACMWTPLDPGQVATGAYQPITIGKYDLGGGITAKRTLSTGLVIPVHIPHPPQQGQALGDYRNLEPYSKYLLWLPGVGEVEIPMSLLHGHMRASGNLNIPCIVSASPTTGDVTYLIQLPNTSGGISDTGVGITFKGNFGVEIPIAQTVGRFGSVLQSVAGAIAGVAMIASGGSAAAIGAGLGLTTSSIINEGIAANTFNTTASGSLGGWSVEPEFQMMIESTTIAYDVSDDPSAVAKTIGIPYYHHVDSIGSLRGLVKCTGAFVKTWGTEEELQMISQYVNSSTNYLYGGLIVE